jgi:hypothetical protein
MAAPGPDDEGHRQHQDEGPETEHDLDFAEQVEQAFMARMAVGQHLETLGGEGVDQGAGEEEWRRPAASWSCALSRVECNGGHCQGNNE